MDGMQMPPGTTECNHSYFSGNSFSVPHFAQQLQHGTPATPAQPPASIQDVDGPDSSSVISSSLLSCSAFSSQVTADPTPNGTGDDMPLAEAITQLSFLEFLQRCGVSIAPPQPSQPPVPISFQDATVQTTPPCDVSQEVSTQTSDQQDTLSCDAAVQTSFYGAHTLSLDAAAQTTSPSMSLRRSVLAQLPRFLLVRLSRTLYAVRYYMMLPHNYRSRSSSLAVFTRTVPWTGKTLFVSPRHQCKVHMPCCSHRQDSSSQPRLLSLPLTLTCLLHMMRLLTVLPDVLSSRLSVPPRWEHCTHSYQRQKEC